MIIIHEYGAPTHYSAAIEANKKFDSTVRFIEFATFRLILRAIKQRQFVSVLKAIKDFLFLFFCFLFPSILKNKYVIIGIAPLDIRVFLFNRILKKSVVTYHSSWMKWDGSKYPKNFKLLNKFSLNSWMLFFKKTVNSFAVVTNTVKEQLVEHMGVDPQKITIVYHSFNNSIFHNNESAILGSKLKVVYAGRLISNKGIDCLIELIKENKNIDFYIIGKGPEEYKLKQLKEHVNNLFLVGFLENKEELAYYYNLGDVLLLPSKRTKDWEELFGMVLIEAMACCCIPLCTDHNGPKMILNNSIFKKNILAEADFVVRANEILQKYNDEPQLLAADKEVAMLIAKKYKLQNVALAWNIVFDNAGR